MFLFLRYFLTFWNNKMFLIYLVIFAAPALDWPFFQAALIPLSGEWYLGIKIWALTVLITTEVSWSLDSLSRNNQEIYVCIMCIHTHIHICMYIHAFIYTYKHMSITIPIRKLKKTHEFMLIITILIQYSTFYLSVFTNPFRQ